MNRHVTQSILPAALFILVSAVFLPDTYSRYSAKEAYVADAVASPVSLQDEDLGKPNGDDQKIIGSPSESIIHPAPNPTTPALDPAPAPDFAFTVSQARAPPDSDFFAQDPFRTIFLPE